jgi:hypothetical protein
MENNSSESRLQFECVMWFNHKYRHCGHLVHVPNARQQEASRGAWWRGQGVVAGFPDLMCIADGRCVLIELKTATGKLSEVQKELHKSIIGLGTDVKVVRTLDEFQAVIEAFLGCEDLGQKSQ